MRIYVGNLTYRSSELDVRKAFESFGEVAMCRLAIDPQTGRSAGFAYVEMPNEDEAQTAIARLNGKEINSRVVTVSQATVEQAPAPPERS
ncbi:MAG: RNA-binding protein, partial [Aureliella sp.]